MLSRRRMRHVRFAVVWFVALGAFSAACGSKVIYEGPTGGSPTGGGGGSSTTGGEDPCEVDGPCTRAGDTCDLGCAGIAECTQGHWQQIVGTDGDPSKCHYDASSTVGGQVGCSVVGTWDGISGVDGSNPSTSASYVFNADGTWLGGKYQMDPSATEFMHGSFQVSGNFYQTTTGDTFSIVQGYGMGPSCAANAPATYNIWFSSDCQTMTLTTTTDDCTGARLYLNASSDGTTLTRRN